ncbi:MAG: M16 family metallopeptidase [Hyphomicrobium sp.]
MAANVTTLANGLRVASYATADSESVSLGLWVGAGARHEADDEHGLSHMLEHMAFKGTGTRSAQKIAEEIEDVGGELNAATGLDTTAYYARVLKGDEGLALELIADILLNSAFAPEELEKEREVILQEIAGVLDSPDDVAFDLMQETAFPTQALGRPILGTPASVKAMQPAQFRGYLARNYHPGQMVVSAAGAINHERFVRHVEALFGGLTPRVESVGQTARYVGGVAAAEKAFEQSHLLVGFPAPSYLDQRFFTAQVFSGLFGGGMSSRLFQEVRERRGLCYSIYSTTWALRDAGMLVVHAATGAEMLEELADVVAGEFADIARRGPGSSELQRAKAQLRAGLLMGLESSSVRAEQMARHVLMHGRLIGVEELSDEVSSVTLGRVQALANEIFRAPPTIAVVGSGRRSQVQAKRAADALNAHVATGL